MKNLMVANLQNTVEAKNDKNKKETKDKLITYLLSQIDNSISMGWKPDQIILVTNFEFRHKGVSSIPVDLNKNCLTGSKIFAINKMFELGKIDEIVWAHDLDAWQCQNFSVGKIKDIGISRYSTSKLNGGSLFFRPSSKDIFKKMQEEIEAGKYDREEPIINKYLSDDGKFCDRTTLLDTTYNLGCSGFVDRYKDAEKPIKVCHFHPTNRIAWDSFVRDRNLIGESPVDDRLYKILVNRFKSYIKNYNYDKDRGHSGNWERPDLSNKTKSVKLVDKTTIIKPRRKEEKPDKPKDKIDEKSGIWPLKEAKKHKHDFLLAGAIASAYKQPEYGIDLGCGDGTYVSILRGCGWNMYGVDGTESVKNIKDIDGITEADLSQPNKWSRKFDFVMSLEVGEHIPKEHEAVFINNVAAACNDKLVLSWASPGQDGRGHVNEQPMKYIIHQFRIRGFEVDNKTTEFLREHSVFSYFKKNITALYLKKEN